MKFLYHLFGIIHFIIWSIIGVALMFGIYKVSNSGAGGMMNFLAGQKNLSGVMSTITNTGNIGELMQKIQSKNGDIAGTYNSLTKTQQDCLKKELGNETITQALAGTLNFTPDLVLKASKCIK